MQFKFNTGGVAEDVWPYNPGQSSEVPPGSLEHAEHYKISRSQPVRNTSGLKSALERFGPVAGGILLYKSITGAEVAKTGKIPMPSPKEQVFSGHANYFVGYDDNEKVFKFRNQWGEAWGDSGYSYISYEYAAKFLTDAWAISMDEPIS